MPTLGLVLKLATVSECSSSKNLLRALFLFIVEDKTGKQLVHNPFQHQVSEAGGGIANESIGLFSKMQASRKAGLPVVTRT